MSNTLTYSVTLLPSSHLKMVVQSILRIKINRQYRAPFIMQSSRQVGSQPLRIRRRGLIRLIALGLLGVSMVLFSQAGSLPLALVALVAWTQNIQKCPKSPKN